MKPSPPKEAAAPPRSKAATITNESHQQPTRQNGACKPYHTRLAAAEDHARQLLYSWTEHGRTKANSIPPERMPTSILRTIAEALEPATTGKAIGWTDALPLFDEDHVRNAFIECTEGPFPATPEACKPLVESLHAFYRNKRRREIVDQLGQRTDSDDPVVDLADELRAIETERGSHGIEDLLAARAFRHDSQPAKPIPRFRLVEMPLCTAGNVTNLQAPPKAGKSAVVDAMLAAVMAGNRQGPDTLGFSAENPLGHALIHMDTEQSSYDADNLVRRAIRRANLTEPPPWFSSYSLADIGIEERREALRHVMDEASRLHGGIFAVMIDGIGDLCADPNDSAEAFDLVHELHSLAIRYDCAVVTVLHENPGSESGKTRGHLGSQLERKAETNLRLQKDAKGITTIWSEKARHCYLPKSQGPCFAWNDERKMHVSIGTAGEISAAANREKMEGEADAAFGGEPSMSYTALCAAIMDALGCQERTAKGRIKTWLAEGVTRKDATGNHHLANP